MRFLNILFLSILFVSAHSQYVGWEYRINTIADNREYFNDYAYPQTILGVRNGGTLKAVVDSFHSINIGGSYLIEYGHDIDAHKFDPDLYYKYSKKSVEVYMGAFPRNGLLHYPLILLTDTLEYFKPNLQGGLATVKGKWGHQHVWIDWTGRQTETRKESFLAGVCGRLKAGIFYFEDYYYMYHNAFTTLKTEDEHIQDNSCLAGYAGIDLSHQFILDSLRLDAGIISTQYRERPAEYEPAIGYSARMNVRYKRLGLDVVYYNGDKPILPWGDKIYTSQNYLRSDLIWIPFKSKHVNSALKFCIHYVDGERNFSQQILVSMKIGKDKIEVPNFVD